jgi:hypothetical protein
VIVHTLPDESDEQAIYWVNDDYNTGPYGCGLEMARILHRPQAPTGHQNGLDE